MIKALAKESEQPNFWDNPVQAASKSQELDVLKHERADFEALGKRLKEMEDLLATDELGSDLLALVDEELVKLERALGEWELRLILGGPYDSADALLTIRSGAGGTEAQDWAEMLLRMYLRYAERRNWRTVILDESRGNEAGIKSVTVEIKGRYAYGRLRAEIGVHRLVRLSPFNADHLRQTSFASVEVMPVIADAADVKIRDEDLRVDTYRASGAGGQHVNKTESAVRVTHIPTGLVAASQSERSQLQNRAHAMKILQAKLLQRELEIKAAEAAKLRGEYKSANFGNQIRSYVLHPYTLVKDHRTGAETAQATTVLDGDLDKFIESALQYLYQQYK